ncbi:hypothetical protein [Staphylococcus edaphicus]|uniref:Lipoprotein n=1 Tax=Staphylococcus edaphicus TaxID=1955013 RepID=A0A2C6U434_9STAP|nr:hypothetical protein [Staphylococcus edaphicus]PHK48642.1 hypothetical protein BTJ66_12435 [Staphylococcus edaphicus]
MKKVSGLLLASFLILTACGDKEESKTDDKKEAKSSNKEKKHDGKKSKDSKDKKSHVDKNNEPKANQNDNSEQVAATEEQIAESNQSQEQQATQVTNQQPTKQEIADWDRQNIAGGTDAGLIDPEEVNRSINETPELSAEEQAEADKEQLRAKYNGGLSSGEMQTKTAIEQGYYDGDNAEEVMKEIEKSEQEIADGKYDKYKE